MKPNQNHAALDINAILGRPLAGQLDSLFHCMKLAEDAIDAAKARTPNHAALIHSAFRALQPSDPLLRTGPEKLYPLHCREILDRVVAGDDLRPATTAELVASLSAFSLEHPLDRAATYLYWDLFSQLFPDDSRTLRSGLEPIAANSSDRARARELEATLRRKLAVKERIAKART